MAMTDLIRQWHSRSGRKRRRIGRFGAFMYVGNKLYRYNVLLIERSRDGLYHVKLLRDKHAMNAAANAVVFLTDAGAVVKYDG